jgi:hypothetical protein
MSAGNEAAIQKRLDNMKEAIPRVLPKIAGRPLKRLSSEGVWRVWCRAELLDVKRTPKPHSYPCLAYCYLDGHEIDNAVYLYPDDIRAMMELLKL